MPELPEVETIVRKLRPNLLDRKISEVEVLWSGTVDRPNLIDFRRILIGNEITGMERRGKFIIFELSSGHTMLVHLRMSGKFSLRSPGAGPGNHEHTRLRLRLDDGSWLDFINQRKFGRFYLVEDSSEIVNPLGPEPLSQDFTTAWLQSALAGRRGEIKRLLLNQHFLAGLGNIYASEALWRARIHPERVAGSLSDEEVRRLHHAIVATLESGIDHGGTSLDDRQYVYPDGRLGAFQEQLCVYDREGEQCPRCGYALERIVQGQRSTYLCPICQKKPESKVREA
jgi:formamidopyrimidine-DNA glycosylase